MIDNRRKYDEVGYAEEILTRGFLTKHIYTEMTLLVLYYRDFFGYKPKERKEALISFCEKNWADYQPELHYTMINRALRIADKHMRLVTVGYVNVFQHDLDVIDSYNVSYDHKKLLFTMLVMLRLDRYYRMLKFDKEYTANIFYATESVMRNVKKLAGLNGRGDLCMSMIPDLVEAGAIKVLYRGKLLLTFMDRCTDTDRSVLEVTCYDDIGCYYDLYNNRKKIGICSECGKPFKKSSNRQMRCKDCREVVTKREYNAYKAEYMRRYREKKRLELEETAILNVPSGL